MTRQRLAVLFSLLVLPVLVLPARSADDGFISLFNGKDLTDWQGLPDTWSVEDGAITGTTTKERPLKFNTFLVWTGGKPADFELRLKYKIVGGNSGIQYRSKILDEAKYIVGGYQADIDSGTKFSGINYEERFRAVLTTREESPSATMAQRT